MAEFTPITLVTGAPGAGKTTLLRQLLDGMDSARTAVLMNGNGGFDHPLAWVIADTTHQALASCGCCGPQGGVAQALRTLTREFGALLFINDDAACAAACGADGVHLGRDDAPTGAVRAQYPALLVGVSCYADLDRACVACAAGADYLAFGSVAPSATRSTNASLIEASTKRREAAVQTSPWL